MCRGPLAYGQATAVSTRELMRPTLVAASTGPLSACYSVQEQVNDTGGQWQGCGADHRRCPSCIADPEHRRQRRRGRDPAPPAPNGWRPGTGRRPVADRPRRPAPRADYPGEEVDRAAAWGLVGTNRPDEQPALDPAGPRRRGAGRRPGRPGPRARSRPQVRRRRVVGRGACDMKAGVAAILAAVAAAQRRAAGRAAVRGALRRRRGGRRAGRVRHPGPRPHR